MANNNGSNFGLYPPFNSESEQWTIYIERLELYFIANGIRTRATNTAIENAEVLEDKRAILLTVIGKDAYCTLRSLTHPSKPTEKSFTELVKFLNDHYEPIPTEIVERYKFYKRDRKTGESVATYVAAIRKAAEFCGFNDNLDTTLRDRLVCGINNDHVQRQLLQIKGITLQLAIEKAKQLEKVEVDTKALKSHEHDDTTVNHVATNRTQRKNTNLPRQGTATNAAPASCGRCTSTEHADEACPYKDYECHHCRKMGHLSKACRNSKKPSRPQTTSNRFKKHDRRKTRARGQTNHVATTEIDNQLPEYDDIFAVTESRATLATSDDIPHMERPPSAIQVSMEINGSPVQFQVDTGSGYTIVSSEMLRSIQHTQPLEPCHVKLASVTGHSLDVQGQLTVTATYKGKSLSLPLVVVGGQSPSLLGRNWMCTAFSILPEITDSVAAVTDGNKQLDALLNTYKEVFTPGMGCLKDTKVKIHIKPDAPQPKFFKARPVPYHLRERVENELRRLEDEGIISPVSVAAFATPVVPVMKKDGSIRLCGDYKVTTNKIVDTEQYPLPKVEDVFAKLAGCVIFARLDMRNAYNQLELDEESKKYVVINTIKGLFTMNRLPVGLSSSAAIFQRYMETLLFGHPCTLPFQDDIGLGGKSTNDLIRSLKQVFQTFLDNGLKLNRAKCQFLLPAMDFLGYRLDAKGLHPQMQKLEAINDAPAPQNVPELRSFLGLVNYYSRFIPTASTLLAPLYSLLHKDNDWAWNETHQATFDAAKRAIQSTDLLVLFDPKKEVILACDASPVGVGAVISHMVEDQERPIAFASRTLSKAEQNYPQIEREALSLIFGITRFRDYLLGKKFTLVTDHKPLVFLFAEDKQVPAMAAARIQRWALMLSAYDYRIIHKKGELHGNADGLSRLPLPTPDWEPPLPAEVVLLINGGPRGPINAQEMAQATAEDPLLKEIIRLTRNGWPNNKVTKENFKIYHRRSNEITIANGILLLGNKVIVPAKLQSKILAELHSSHQGVRQMKELARSKVWWPGIDASIESMAQSCEVCRQNAPKPSTSYSPWPAESAPWRRVHTDFAGPLDNRYLLVTVDAFSKWIEVDVTRSTSSTTVIQCLRQHMARFGVIPLLVSDNGPCFTSKEFREFVVNNGIEHLTTAPYHPQSNGQAERTVRTVKTTLKKLNGDTNLEVDIIAAGLDLYTEGTLDARLARFLVNYRRTPIRDGKSPSDLFLGRSILTKMDLFHPKEAETRKYPASGSYEETRKLVPGKRVLALNFGVGVKWKIGTIMKLRGSIMFEIITDDGFHLIRHKDQIRLLKGNEPDERRPQNREKLASSAEETPIFINRRSRPKQLAQNLHLAPRVATASPQPQPAVVPTIPARTSPPPVTSLRRSTRATKQVIKLNL